MKSMTLAAVDEFDAQGFVVTARNSSRLGRSGHLHEGDGVETELASGWLLQLLLLLPVLRTQRMRRNALQSADVRQTAVSAAEGWSTPSVGRLCVYSDGSGGNGRVVDESTAEVEWGGIANLSLRVGGGSKIGLKNLYTRSAEEVLIRGSGYSTENNTIFDSYGVQYVERELLQSQLSGEHVLGFLFGSRLDWKGTLAWANRDEPDSRNANYVKNSGTPTLTQLNYFNFRELRDRIRTGQVDLNIPLSLRYQADAALKFGGLLRDKPRTYTSTLFNVNTAPSVPMM